MKLRQLRRFKEIEKRFGIKFLNKNFLKKALTHISAVGGQRTASNEIFEFLGDAVLELVVREFLIKKFPQKDEGALNELKKKYTSEEILYKIGKRLGIGDFLIMDRGEELSGGRQRVSNISSGFESLIGAIYLDRGLDYAKRYLRRIFLNRRLRSTVDYKSLLNRWAMKEKKAIVYKVLKEEGPPHNRTFHIALFVSGEKVSSGIGKSKKKAEREAAKRFLKSIAE